MEVSWIRPEQLLEFEFIQLEEEAKNVDKLKRMWAGIKSEVKDPRLLRSEAVSFLEQLEVFKKYLNNRGVKSFLDNLKSKNEDKPGVYSSEKLYDKILGGWNGRAAGCLLGKPIEKYSREVIKNILSSNNTWPLDNYITAHGIPEEILKNFPWNKHDGKESLRENIICMTEDDDMNYTMLNLYVLEKYGKVFTTGDVGEAWLNILPVLSTFTAERIAYYNLLSMVDLPRVPIYHNPYREWIGAMIRADLWGWISPGKPLQAANFAYKDASLSHTGNGIYGAMFIAAAIASSFNVDHPLNALTEALNFIPEDCMISQAVRFGISVAGKYQSWELILDALHKEYGKYFWVHSVNNMALISASLVYGDGDFEKTICCTVMGGLDTDSSGATVGSILGTINGFGKLPPKWMKPLNNKIRSSLKGFDNSNLSYLAERTCRLAVGIY